MRVGLPSGIGDFSWAWSKLYAVRHELHGIEIADGWPYRTTPYVDLCLTPIERRAVPSAYGAFDYRTIQLFQAANGWGTPQTGSTMTWQDVRDEIGTNPEARVLLEPNRWLERGLTLDGWLPDLPTEYHYPLYTSVDDGRGAVQHLAHVMNGRPSRPVVGISCASYRGSEAWKTWGREEWVRFLKRVIALDWQPLILGGFWDDLSHGVASELRLPDLVGRTSVGEMVELLRLLPAYLGFSSGLNVIRTVVNRPAFALWPDHQEALALAWAPPDMITSRRYVAHLWRPVEDVWPAAHAFLDHCRREMEERDDDAPVEKAEGECREGAQDPAGR